MPERVLRHEGSVTSLSWIPSEAVEGTSHLAFEAGLTHYDNPPPERLEDLEALRVADRFRFANVLRAWVEVDQSAQIVGAGYGDSGCVMGSTTVSLGGLHYRFQPVTLPDLRKDPEHGEGWVRFVQTTGGRTGMPAPRRVRRKPYLQWQAPLVWTTLAITLHSSGKIESDMIGASRFPRHWVYDEQGALSRKSGLTDFRDWYTRSPGPHTPWGDQDSEALVTTVESALERSLSASLMRGSSKPRIVRLAAGTVVMAQGEPGEDMCLVLDGVVRVERDGEQLAEYGPGALLGERAHLEGGRRAASVVAVTPCRLAVFHPEQLDRTALETLSQGHRREEHSG